MLKSVGASGQLSLGKKYAGRYFLMQTQADGSIHLKPMKVVHDSAAGDRSALDLSVTEPKPPPYFKRVKVRKIVTPSRDSLHER